MSLSSSPLSFLASVASCPISFDVAWFYVVSAAESGTWTSAPVSHRLMTFATEARLAATGVFCVSSIAETSSETSSESKFKTCALALEFLLSRHCVSAHVCVHVCVRDCVRYCIPHVSTQAKETETTEGTIEGTDGQEGQEKEEDLKSEDSEDSEDIKSEA
jgi:hypothetical protein